MRIAIAVLAVLTFGLALTGCRASGEIGDTSTSIVAPK
jgi:hypothetical protein